MKSATLYVVMTILIASIIGESALQAQQATPKPNYLVFPLSTFGGTASAGLAINNLGWVMGSANLAGDQTENAALWINGKRSDLGTLGGPNSSVEWESVKNNHGLIVGVSDTSTPQPLGEVWSCAIAFFPSASGNTCLGFLWQNGEMTPLPTLGGDNGVATGVNNLAQVVGWAETNFHDPTCSNPVQVLQFLPYVYDVNTKQIQSLPPFPRRSRWSRHRDQRQRTDRWHLRDLLDCGRRRERHPRCPLGEWHRDRLRQSGRVGLEYSDQYQ